MTVVILIASILLSKASRNSINDSIFAKSKVIQYDRVRFKEYRDSVPRWGLVVSSDDLVKISKCQMMQNVDVVPISENQIEVIADYDTLSALFVWEGINPSWQLPIYDSEKDLLIQNDTQSINDGISINIETQTEAEMDAEPDRSLVSKTKQHRRDIKSEIIAKILSAAVILVPVVVVLVYIYTLK